MGLPGTYILGIAGGSGSGKTTVSRSLQDALAGSSVLAIQHDAYYRHRPELTDEARAQINFDHPSALENTLLIQHLDDLREGRAVELPDYDFSSHLRRSATTRVTPKRVIIVEGILVLADPALRDRFDLKLYVDTEADIRLMRRILRDTSERGRTVEQVSEQYCSTVRPMHQQFVEPSKRFADLVLVEGGASEVAIDALAAMLKSVSST